MPYTDLEQEALMSEQISRKSELRKRYETEWGETAPEGDSDRPPYIPWLEADNAALRERVEGLDQIAEDALWHDGHDNPEALEDIRKTLKALGYTQAAILVAAGEPTNDELPSLADLRGIAAEEEA